MIKTESIKEKDIIPEFTFHQVAAQCFLLFQRYRLKTNVLGFNLEKEMIPECYGELEGRVVERYDLLYEQLQNGINNLQKNFKIAKATHLRSLNNVLRDYRRRVGTISHQPLNNFKYNKFDRSEKILLESMVYNEKDGFDDIVKFKQELTIAMEQGKTQLKDHYKPDPKIKENFKLIVEVIDKSQCYTYKYYDNFQRSMQNTINTLQSYFDKLNGYLTVWQNIASVKAYEIKSAKQLEIDDKIANPFDSRKYNEEYSEEQLEELLESCPASSPLKEEYRQRLTELKHTNKEKDRKMEQVGKMFNKRRNRAGILINKRREISTLDWYLDLDGEKANFSYADEFRNCTTDNIQTQYRPTDYQLQKPFKRQKVEEIKEHMSKVRGSQLNFEWWYDKYGKDGGFDLILCGSQQMQKRLQFETTKQVDLQQADDRKKRDVFDKKVQHFRDSERRQGLHLGYLYAIQKEEIDMLEEKPINIEYFPDLIAEEDSSSIQFSDEEQQHLEEDGSEEQIKEEPQKESQKIKKKKNVVKKQESSGKQESVKVQEKQLKKQEVIQEQVQQEHQFDFNQADSQQQLIEVYFKEYSLKVLRKEADPQYKKSKFLYFPDLEQIDWQLLKDYFPCQKIFIYTKSEVIYLKRIFSSYQQKIKCHVYSLQQELDEQQIRLKITDSFKDLALVTVKFVSIYTELEQQSRIYFMIGLVITLIREGDMPENMDIKNYIHEGKLIVEDFQCYINPHIEYTSRKVFNDKIVFGSVKNTAQGSQFSDIATMVTGSSFDKRSALKGKECGEMKRQKMSSPNMKVDEKQKIIQEVGGNITQGHFSKEEEFVHQAQLQNLMEQQLTMKKSNSRQNLMVYQQKIQTVPKSQQEDNSEDENEGDYESF